jgi:peptidoglycan/LPS O-acetylase OafA/YrhL
MKLNYRADIDGLRAFSVTSVLIFHAFPSLIPGGFVGVDVFFVISGYLISSILFSQLESATFSFANFYAHRIKRIFPALITMLTASYAFGWFYLFNEDFARLGSHIYRASLFLSNLILWREAGYFDHAAETKPLLHLWSLGIEEQFYIVWPVILWALWRVKALRFPLIASLTLSSLVWSLYQSQHDLTHDFYSPLTRFWELSAGAWLAFHVSRHAHPTRHANALSGFALCLLLASVTVIDTSKNFPGAWALMPVLGAVLLIYAGPATWCSRVLFSNPAWVWIGSISYPLYLWHWPALAFARIVEGATPSIAIRLGALVLAFLLAWGTFVWIEKPIRFGAKNALRTPLLLLALVGVGYAGQTCYRAAGYPTRPIMQAQVAVNAGDIGHDTFHAYYGEHFLPCADARVQAKSGKWGNLVRCFQTQRDAPIDLVMIGDSHAEHLLLGMSEALPHLNMAVYQRSHLPFTSSAEYAEIFESVVNDTHIKFVLLAAMWADAPFKAGERATFERDLNTTVQLLTSAGKQVFVADDTPKFGFDPQRCKFNHPLSGRHICEESNLAYHQVLASYVPILERAMASNPQLHLIRLNDVFCDDQMCHMAQDGHVLFRDSHHVNVLGSRQLGAVLAQQITDKAPVLAAKPPY